MTVTYRGRTLRYRPYRHRRVRYRGQRMSAAHWAGLGLAAVVALGGGGAIAHHHHHHHGGGAAVSVMAAPGTICCSRTAWAQAFLAAIPEPVTAANVCAVVVWETREAGGFGNQASYNPLNLNPGAGAGWPGYPAIGAWAFPDARTGLAYTVTTVRSYGGILAALHAGNNPPAVWAAIMASPWATTHYDGTLGGNC